MSLPKYFEDNVRISDERSLLASGEDYPFFEVPKNLGNKLILQSFIKTEGIKAVQKNQKHAKKKIVCVDCGETFWFKGAEQKYFKKHKLEEPKRCAECRAKRKEHFKRLEKGVLFSYER